MSDSANWFQPFGNCQQTGCRKPAAGTVIGTRNETLGRYCEQHGKARVASAQRERMNDSEGRT